MEEKIKSKMEEARDKAIDSLSRYKFLMFGYHAAQWVTLNKLLEKPEPNPFRVFVKLAKKEMDKNAQRDSGKLRRERAEFNRTCP